MKQVTFSESQWDLLNMSIIRVKVHAYNQWLDWHEQKGGILLAGMELSDYERELDRRWHKYSDLSQLHNFLLHNARDIEEDKA